MNLVVDRSPNLHGVVKVPPNKSQSFRALIMAGLAEGDSRIIAPAVSNDWMLGTEALEMFGAKVEPHAGDVWEVAGTAGRVLHAGVAGREGVPDAVDGQVGVTEDSAVESGWSG